MNKMIFSFSNLVIWYCHSHVIQIDVRYIFTGFASFWSSAVYVCSVQPYFTVKVTGACSLAFNTLLGCLFLSLPTCAFNTLLAASQSRSARLHFIRLRIEACWPISFLSTLLWRSSPADYNIRGPLKPRKPWARCPPCPMMDNPVLSRLYTKPIISNNLY